MAKVLVIGGTQFIGRHVVQRLIDAHHSVTLLNRGKTGPKLFPEVPRIHADRESPEIANLSELRQDWDAVIDLCAFFPKDVTTITDVLKGRAGRYILCSTLSAYQSSAMEGPTPIIDETSPLRGCSEIEARDTTLASYGQRKAECERVAMGQHSTGVPTIILRPCVVYGKFDHTDRFAYWIWRASRPEPFILPDDGLTIIRRTYAPDLAKAFEASLTSHSALGNAYNIAETDPLSFRDTLFWIGKRLGTSPLEHAVSISGDELTQRGIKPWVDLPMWLPQTNLLVDTYRSRRDLAFVSTPAEQAVGDAADAFLSEGREPRTGLSRSVEQEIISKSKRHSTEAVSK